MLRDAEQAKLRSNPYEERGDGGGKNETRHAVEGRLGHGVEGPLLISLAAQLDRLEGAHVARHHAEDGDAQPALDEDTDVGLLEEANLAVLAHGRIEQLFVQPPCYVGQNHERRRQSAEALDAVELDGTVSHLMGRPTSTAEKSPQPGSDSHRPT